MKIINRLLFVLALACTLLPVAGESIITVQAKEDKGLYPMACAAYEVDNVNASGGFDTVGCYNDYSSALAVMKTLSDDGVVRHAGSYSQTRIIAMNNGIAYAYPFRSGSTMMYYFSRSDLSASGATTYSYQHVPMAYYDTISYNGSGEGSVRININGFDGYVDLKNVDLVPVRFFKTNQPILMGGNESYYNTPEQPYWLRPSMNSFEVIQNGNYKDMIFRSYSGYSSAASGAPEAFDTYTILPAAEWMETGRTYYSYDAIHYYYDVAFHDYAGEYFIYYQFLPLRSRSSIPASAYDNYLNDAGISSSSKLRGNGQAFIDGQNQYGVNALLTYAMACLESGHGTSYISQTKNNFFGWKAYDSDISQAASFSSVKDGIMTQMATNLAGYLDMDDWRFYGSMLGNKGNGLNVKYCSAVYWGLDIAAIAYRIDKTANQFNGSLTDLNKETLGYVRSLGAYASFRADGTKDYDLSSAGRSYQSYPMVVILSEEGDWYRTQCTNPIVNGKIHRVFSVSDARAYDWENSVGYWQKKDLTIVSESVNAGLVPSGPRVETSSDLVWKDQAVTFSGSSYRPGIWLSEENQITVVNELVDASLKPVMTLNTAVSTEGKDVVRWQTASSDLSELPNGIYYFRSTYTYSRLGDYSSWFYITGKEVPEDMKMNGKLYHFVLDDQNFVRLEVSAIRCAEGEHLEENACVVDPPAEKPAEETPPAEEAPTEETKPAEETPVEEVTAEPEENAEEEQPKEIPVDPVSAELTQRVDEGGNCILLPDDANMLRGIDSITLNENQEVELNGMAFFVGKDAKLNGSVAHALVLVNTETGEEITLPAETNDYDHLMQGGRTDYEAVGFAAKIPLLTIPEGSYYVRIRTNNSGRIGEGAIFTSLDADYTVENELGQKVHFFANPLSHYRLEISVEYQNLDTESISRPSRMISRFGYNSLSVEEGILKLNGFAFMYGTDHNQETDPQYRLWLQDESGTVFGPYEAEERNSDYDYSKYMNLINDMSRASFRVEADLKDLPNGLYRIYLGIDTDTCHDLFEIYSLQDDQISSASKDHSYELFTTNTRRRILLDIE